MSILVNSVYVSQNFLYLTKVSSSNFATAKTSKIIIRSMAEFNLTDVANQIEKWVIMT
jgi:hypothetical protein